MWLGKMVSLVNRLRRFLDNPQVNVRRWYEPMVRQVVATFAGKQLRLVIDCTKVGLNHRLLMVGLAYRKRTLPLAWSVHKGSRGTVPTEEQIALMQQICPLISPTAEVWVLGDTAFEHVPFLRWCGDAAGTLSFANRVRLWFIEPDRDGAKTIPSRCIRGRPTSLGECA